MVLRLDDIRKASDGLWRVIFWASGDDFEAYEKALESHPTVACFRRLADLEDRRLYSTTLSAAVGRTSSTIS